jgi:hypothetical protein
MALGLVELIEQLKKDIGPLQYSEPPLFNIETVELELKFLVEEKLGAGGKALWVLFAAEAKAEYKDQHINTIKLTLKPMRGETIVLDASSDPNWKGPTLTETMG